MIKFTPALKDLDIVKRSVGDEDVFFVTSKDQKDIFATCSTYLEADKVLQLFKAFVRQWEDVV